MKKWRPSQTEVVIWLRMIMRACYLLTGAAAVLGLSDAVVAMLMIVTGLCDYRLSLYSDRAVGEARNEPSPSEEQLRGRITELQRQNADLRRLIPLDEPPAPAIPREVHHPPPVPTPPDQPDGETLPGWRVDTP